MRSLARNLLFTALVFSIPTGLTQAQEASWCPVTEAPILEEQTLPYLEQFGDVIAVTFRTSDGFVVGSSVTIPDVENPRLSSDALHLAYLRQPNAFNSTLVTHASNGELPERVLVTPEEIAPLRPEENMAGYGLMQYEWITETDKIAFNTRAYYDGDGIFEPIADDLWTVDLSGTVTNLLAPGEGGYFTLSPDGTYAVIEGQNQLKLFNFATGAAQVIPLENYRPFGIGHGLAYPQVDWRADSSGFLIAISPTENPLMAQTEGVVEVWQIMLDSGTELIGTHTAFPLSFVIAPDQQKVAYWRTEEAFSNQRTLIIASVDGRETQEILTAHLLDFDRWLDDSEHFVYSVIKASSERITLIGDICQTIPLYTED